MREEAIPTLTDRCWGCCRVTCEAVLHVLPVAECVVLVGPRGSSHVRPSVGLARGVRSGHVTLQVTSHRQLVAGPVSRAFVKIWGTGRGKGNVKCNRNE